MRQDSTSGGRSAAKLIGLVLMLLAALPGGSALADDTAALYLGGAVGQARVEASLPTFGDFRENHTAYKFMLGTRPIAAFGAEVAYLDFGHPHVSPIPAIAISEASLKGVAAFGMLYLPIPIIDIYLKAGVARLQSSLTTFDGVLLCTTVSPTCQTRRFDRTDTGFAAGAGVQVRFGSLAVRGEYERFSAAGGYPGLVSLGLTVAFP
jgi:opacity protein-like surface antigen